MCKKRSRVGHKTLLFEEYVIQPVSQAAIRLETILVVDDDPEWRDYLCRIVGRKYPVIFAYGGDEALRIASHTDTKVIILDVMMAGGKDGLSTFCALKRNPATSGIPVIILSEVHQLMGLDFSADAMREHLGNAPFAFLEKPVSPEALIKMIETAITSGIGSRNLSVGISAQHKW